MATFLKLKVKLLFILYIVLAIVFTCPHSSALYTQLSAKANAKMNYNHGRVGHLPVIFYCKCPTLFLIVLVQTTLDSSGCNILYLCNWMQDQGRPLTQTLRKIDLSDVQERNKAKQKWWAWAIRVTAVREFK